MVEIKKSQKLVNYPDAVQIMENRVDDILVGKKSELIWLLEHPPLYTAGTSSNPSDLTNQLKLPVFDTGRGGQYTYHGPGQRVVYVMLDLNKRGRSIREFVNKLQDWVILTLQDFQVTGSVHCDRIGIWIDPRANKLKAPFRDERKIAALGIRIRKWISFHGVSININPDLTHFRGIVPCGIKDYGVTSLSEMGMNTSYKDFDERLIHNFNIIFDTNSG